MQITTLLTTPLNFIYILLCTPWLLSHFLLDVLLYILPWTRPAREWSLNQAARMRVVRLVLLYWSMAKAGNTLTLRPGRERNRLEIIHPQPSEVYTGVLVDTYIQPKSLAMTWTPSRPPPAKSIKSNLTVALHFHGGGFVIGNGRDEDTGYLARTLIRHMGSTHVCTPQYRLSSGKNGRFPAPLQDALTAYLCLVRDKRIPAAQIILSGDSAGANMALGLLRYIRDHGEEHNIPLPAAVALWSPWVDVSGALHQDIKMSPNYKTDYLSKEFGRWGALTISGFGAIDPSSPYLSPLHHPFKLSRDIPMFVHAGEREVLCDDIKAFTERYQEIGWRAHLVVSKASPHDILLLGPKIGFANEAEDAARKAGACLTSSTDISLRGFQAEKV